MLSAIRVNEVAVAIFEPVVVFAGVNDNFRIWEERQAGTIDQPAAMIAMQMGQKDGFNVTDVSYPPRGTA